MKDIHSRKSCEVSSTWRTNSWSLLPPLFRTEDAVHVCILRSPSGPPPAHHCYRYSTYQLTWILGFHTCSYNLTPCYVLKWFQCLCVVKFNTVMHSNASDTHISCCVLQYTVYVWMSKESGLWMSYNLEQLTPTTQQQVFIMHTAKQVLVEWFICPSGNRAIWLNKVLCHPPGDISWCSLRIMIQSGQILYRKRHQENVLTSTCTYICKIIAYVKICFGFALKSSAVKYCVSYNCGVPSTKQNCSCDFFCNSWLILDKHEMSKPRLEQEQS